MKMHPPVDLTMLSGVALDRLAEHAGETQDPAQKAVLRAEYIRRGQMPPIFLSPKWTTKFIPEGTP